MPHQYSLEKPIYAIASTVLLETAASVTISDGDLSVSPLAVRYALNVAIRCNDAPVDVALGENLLNAFLLGDYCRDEGTAIESFQQTASGFSVVFTPGLLGNGATAEQLPRAYIQQIDIELNYSHIIQSVEQLFAQMLPLADYALATWFQCLAGLAPAVFGGNYERVRSLTATYAPLAQALGIGSAGVVEKAAEVILVPPEKPLDLPLIRTERQTSTLLPGRFMRLTPFEYPDYGTSSDEECEHVFVTLDELLD